MRTKLTILIACLVLVVASISLIRYFWHPVPVISRDRFIGVGEVLAQETAKLLQDHGRIVVVLDDQLKNPKNPVNGQWEAFQKELTRHPGITISDKKTVDADPNEIRAWCPADSFEDILTRNAKADAIVFFVGLADWSLLAARGRTPQAVSAKVIVGENFGTPSKNEYGGYFSSGVLAILIAGRIGPGGPDGAKPRSPREWFDRYYQIYTRENYESLPEAVNVATPPRPTGQP